MTPLTKKLIQQSISIAHDTHLQLVQRGVYDTTVPFEYPAKLLQRLLNLIMSDRTATKKTLAYFLGNQLFRCYFKMNNHRMCKMVFDTLSKSGIERGMLGRGDRVTFEYYLGRYELHQLHFRRAREHLLYCFHNCLLNAPNQQRYTSLTPPSLTATSSPK
jgi:nuclear mRNA export protein PCID2/THP1